MRLLLDPDLSECRFQIGNDVMGLHARDDELLRQLLKGRVGCGQALRRAKVVLKHGDPPDRVGDVEAGPCARNAWPLPLCLTSPVSASPPPAPFRPKRLG